MKRSLGDAGELFPQSVFIIASYDESGVPNAMNAAWAGECTRHEYLLQHRRPQDHGEHRQEGRLHRSAG